MARPNYIQTFFLQEYLSNKAVFHGGIGCIDIERVLLAQGFRAIIFPHHDGFSIAAKWARFMFLAKCLAGIPPHSVVVFQLPMYVTLHRLLIKWLRYRKNTLTLVCCVTDIDGLKDADPELLKKELSFLRNTTHLIVHNNSMKDWVVQHIPQASVAQLEFFDFLALPQEVPRSISKEIVFAGNLSKSGFLNQLQEVEKSLRFNIYGEKEFLKRELPENVQYKGQFEPYALPQKLQGSFGLVWDGDSIMGLAGVFGEYARFISPHKLSLYIISALPVICHKDSAAAALVLKYGIGFTITSLHQISAIIKSLEEEQYVQMMENCKKLAKKITTGGCLIAALKDLKILQ